jgi:hypothetical protein
MHQCFDPERAVTWTSRKCGGSSARHQSGPGSTNKCPVTGSVTPTHPTLLIVALRFILFRRPWAMLQFQRQGDTFTLDRLIRVRVIFPFDLTFQP